MSAPCPRFGFIITAASMQAAEALRHVLIEHPATTGLEIEPSADNSSTLIVTREGSQATDGDRQLIMVLLNGELKAGGARVYDLVDLNY
jgi:hypothetical protein